MLDCVNQRHDCTCRTGHFPRAHRLAPDWPKRCAVSWLISITIHIHAPGQARARDDRFKDIPMTDQQAPPTRRALTLDVAKYQAYLDDTSIPEHRKKEMIDVLWGIIVAFIDLRYDVVAAPAKRAENCGELQVLSAECTASGVGSTDTLQKTGGPRDA